MKQGISPAVAVVVVLIVVIVIAAIGYFVFLKPKPAPTGDEAQMQQAPPPGTMAGEEPGADGTGGPKAPLADSPGPQ